MLVSNKRLSARELRAEKLLSLASICIESVHFWLKQDRGRTHLDAEHRGKPIKTTIEFRLVFSPVLFVSFSWHIYHVSVISYERRLWKMRRKERNRDVAWICIVIVHAHRVHEVNRISRCQAYNLFVKSIETYEAARSWNDETKDIKRGSCIKE